LSGISGVPPLHVAYCLANQLASANGQPSLFYLLQLKPRG